MKTSKRSSNKSRRKSVTKTKSTKSDLNITKFFIHLLNTIKLYHWSTLSYPTHKATDEAHQKIEELVDSFMEILLGKPGMNRSIVSVSNCTIKSYTFVQFKKYIETCKITLNNLTHKTKLITEKDTDLLNLRDEIVAVLNQFTYLLTLK